MCSPVNFANFLSEPFFTGQLGATASDESQKNIWKLIYENRILFL